MSDVEQLESYFDALLADNGKYPCEHILADDNERFEKYQEIKENCTKLIQLNDRRKSQNIDCTILEQIAQMSNEDIDYCLRKIAVSKVLDGSGGNALENLIEYLGDDSEFVALFFNDHEKKSLISMLVHSLNECESGVIVKDKKMIEILRAMKLSEGIGLAGLAIKKMPQKSKSVEGLIASGKKRHSDGVKKRDLT